MTVILSGQVPRDVVARTDGDALWLSPGDAEAATGWTLKPEGLCRDDVCVAVPPGREAEFIDGDAVNLAAFWRQAGKPVLHDAASSTWLLGEDAGVRAAALTSLDAPDFTLPDSDGVEHSLSDYRGRKIFLATWASW